MNDRTEEIKARCEAATRNENPSMETACYVVLNDVPFLLDEIDRLKMMLDAAASGQETMQKQWAADVAERDAAVEDLRLHGDCDTCKHDTTLACNIDGETGICNYEWRGVQK